MECVSFYCSECVINWAATHLVKSDKDRNVCPRCGSSVARRQEPPSADADEQMREIKRQEISRHNHELFEEYYANRALAMLERDANVILGE